MNPAKRRKLKSRANRIAGQVNGIQRMIDEERYCVEVLDQIAAVRSALDALGVELLSQHLESCVMGHGTDHQHADAKPMSQQELLAEVQAVFSRFIKS